jgi:CubicO group peptidase (beta-lactamase class C family)
MFSLTLAAAALAIASAQPAPGTAPTAASEPPPVPPAAVLITFDRTGAEQTRVLRGVANRASGRPLTADDPVRIASISKLVVAMGVMRLVDQRKLDLDADVSRYLGWRLRHPSFPDRLITLRHLLSHRTGMVDGIDYGLPLDGDLQTTLVNPAAWAANRRPGPTFAYANINFPVVAAAMEGATGERFDRLIHRLVLQPLRIDGCFNWTMCSDAAVARAVTLYRPNGNIARDDLAGQRPACPVARARDGSCDLSTYRLARNGSSFGPQGGLRISARGLARIGQLLLRDDGRFLSRRAYRTLTTSFQPVAPLDATVGEGGEGSFFCRYGLAIQQLATRRPGCRDDPFADGRPRIGHAGEAYSLLSGLWVDVENGTGVAYFVTQSPEFDAPAGARSAFKAAEEEIITAADLESTTLPPRR